MFTPGTVRDGGIGLSTDPTEATCELCEAARLTERFLDDELCWIAECESCAVPMVVWRRHDPSPPADVAAELHARLASAVASHFDGEFWIDDRLRSIPTHYHAHARPKGAFAGPGLRRRSVDESR